MEWCKHGQANSCPPHSTSIPLSSSLSQCLCNPGYFGDASISPTLCQVDSLHVASSTNKRHNTTDTPTLFSFARTTTSAQERESIYRSCAQTASIHFPVPTMKEIATAPPTQSPSKRPAKWRNVCAYQVITACTTPITYWVDGIALSASQGSTATKILIAAAPHTPSLWQCQGGC